ncbi:MAG TPA: methyl-accepting chemotaxis protein, partial [Bacillota bacterium]|nr:methyl-accepting chemotaxis protein [Bacillota bacterium]
DASSEGNLGVRGDADKFTGEYQRLIVGFNDTLDAVVGPLQAAADYMERIGRGDLPEIITGEYRGDYNQIKDSLNACIMGIKALVDESLRLSVAASAGQLTVRGDLDQFAGEYRQVIQGLNDTMDAVVAPLTEAKGVLGKMAVNDFTVEMTGTYQGMLKEFADEINLVRNRLLNIQEIFIRVAQGDISQLGEYRSRGKQSENDQLVPAAITMMQSIQDLIDEAEVVAKAAADGRLEVRGDVQKLSGKYQNIVLGMNHALDSMGQPIIEALTCLEAMAHGDLSRTIDGQYQGDYARIQEALNGTITAFNQILGAINVAAEQVTAASRELSVGSQAVSQGATEQAATIEELSASTEAMASHIKQNALLAGQAVQLANATKLSASLGNNQMQEMLQAMQQINEAADNIAKIIKVIDEIAFQTNILALNAAVEAARAGQSGKGFAVVAQEVRNLAGRSANAAKETAELIESSLRRTGEGARIANQTAEALGHMVVDVTKTVGLMEGIASASNEQATGIAQINQGVNQVAIVTQTNTATAEESASSSEELLSQAENLRRLVGKFRLK